MSIGCSQVTGSCDDDDDDDDDDDAVSSCLVTCADIMKQSLLLHIFNAP